VTGYGGWCDLVLVSGISGARAVLREIARVLRQGGKVAIVTISMKRMAQTISEKINRYRFGRPRFLPVNFFLRELRGVGIAVLRQKAFRAPELKPKDEAEILASLHEESEYYEKYYGIKTKPAELIWQKFGKAIAQIRQQPYHLVVLTGMKMRR
jgi:SAM-dependent methyltransferase